MNRGIVRAMTLDDRHLHEDKQVAIYDPTKGAYVEIAKLSHMVRDQWVTETGRTILYDWECKELLVQDNSLFHWTIRDKDYSKALNLIGKEVDYVFNPLPFKEGHYSMECVECHSHFTASKSQAYCKECCAFLGTASLVFGEAEKAKKFKPIKEKSIPLSQVKALLSGAFDAGRFSKIEFDDWYNRQDL